MNAQNALQLSKMKNSSQEMREYAFKMEEVKKNLSAPVDKEKKLREACEGFESVFIQKMWEQMRATVPDAGMLKGREEKFWQGMYDQELAKTMSAAGGIGLADMMYEQLSRNLRVAGKNTAEAVASGQSSPWAMELTPAPLMRPEQNTTQNTTAGAEERPPVFPAGRADATNLYSEFTPPQAPPDLSDEASPVSGAPEGENDVNPAVAEALRNLRASAPVAQPFLPLPLAGTSSGAQAPPEEARGFNLVSTLGKPVHKPASGKRTVMPRASGGPRVSAGQPVNRNMPFAAQRIQGAQPEVQDAPQTGALPDTDANAQAGAENGNISSAQRKIARYASEAAARSVAPKFGS